MDFFCLPSNLHKSGLFAPKTPLLYDYHRHYHHYCSCSWLGDCVIAAGERCQIPTAVPSAEPRRRHPDWEYSVSQVPLLPPPADGNNLTLCFKNFSPELIYWCMPARFPPPLSSPPTILVHLFSFGVTRRLSGFVQFFPLA